jgi:hypothetical protein
MTPVERIAINEGEANRLDAKGKMRYKPLASRSWHPAGTSVTRHSFHHEAVVADTEQGMIGDGFGSSK